MIYELLEESINTLTTCISRLKFYSAELIIPKSLWNPGDLDPSLEYLEWG